MQVVYMQVKFRVATTKAAFTRKKTLSTSKLDLNLRRKPEKCYIWSIEFYGAKTLTHRKVYQKYLGRFECGTGEGLRRSVGPIV